MLWDGGMEGGPLGCEPKVGLGSRAVPGEGAVPQAAGQGEGGRQETEVPGWCWHMG